MTDREYVITHLAVIFAKTLTELNEKERERTMGKPMIYSESRKVERLAMEVYKGYEFAVMNLGTHPCCYIKLPKGHKYYGKNYNDIPLSVHGGLTYSEKHLWVTEDVIDETGWWIGWDYAHIGDYLGFESVFRHEYEPPNKLWTIEELEQDCRNAIDELIEIMGA